MPDQQNIQTVISTTVDTSQAQTGIVNLRKEYQGAFSDVQQTTKGTVEYFEALQKAADARSQITELRREIKLLDPREQFQAVATSIKGLTGGMQAAAGAAVLFGSKNKELEETLRQVLGAAQLFAGIQEFINGLRRSGDLIGILNLKLQQNALVNKEAAVATEATTVALEGETIATEEAAIATGGFNTVLAASAIGAILLLIPLFVSGMSDVGKSTKDAAAGQKALNDAHDKAAANLSDDYSKVGLLIKEYKDQNTTLAEKKAIQDQLQSDYPNYFGNLDKEHDKVGTLDKDYQKWSKAIILKAEADADAQIIQAKTQELIKAQLDPASTLSFWDKVKAALASSVAGTKGFQKNLAEEASDNVKKLVEENKAGIDALTQDFIKSQQQIDALGGDPTKKTEHKEKRLKAVKDENEKISEEFRKFYLELQGKQLTALEESAKNIQEYVDKVAIKQQEGRDQELAKDNLKYKELLENAMLNGEDITSLENAHRQNQATINEKWNAIDAAEAKDARNEHLSEEIKNDRLLLANKNTTLAQKKAILDKELKNIQDNYAKNKSADAGDKKALQQDDDEYTNQVQENSNARKQISDQEVKNKQDELSAISSLLSAASELAGQSTATGKALSAASVVISTYLSAQKAYESAFLPVPTIASPVIGAIAAGASIVLGLNNLKNLLAVPVPGQGGAGASVSTPSAPSYTPTPVPQSSQVVNLGQGTINQINQNQQNAPVRAFVVERDISNSQATANTYRQQATIGGTGH
jgi:hypothetical protein